MRDIVERLELQAFVADKIQSGMKPLIMDCLNEITNLRERLAEADEANRRVSDENEKLREALSALAKHCNEMEAQNHDYHTMGEGGAPCISEPLANAYNILRAAAATLKESGE